MKFSRLLAAGKSLIGVKDTHSPYRMRTPNFLPKFESPKNPFAKTQKNDAPPSVSPLAALVMPQPVKVATTPAIMETLPLFDAELKPASVPVPVGEAVHQSVEPVAIRVEPRIACVPVADIISIPDPVSKPAAKRPSSRPIPPTSPLAPQPPTLPPVKRTPPIKKPATFKNFVKMVNPLTHFSSGAVNNVIKKSRPVRMPVQAELSLENVRVMRNDLNDSDLEVISGTPSPKSEAPQATTQREAGEENALSRLTSRFFGPGQTQVQ